jgi:ribosomal protein L39E
MSEELPESKKTQLAYAIAQGKSVPAWARQNEVARSTAYYWASQPEVRRVVEAWRRQALDRALGRMAGSAAAAIDGISKLAKGAESESVKLRAWRAILTDQIAVSKHMGWEGRLADLEEKMTAQSQGPNFQRGPGPVGTQP